LELSISDGPYSARANWRDGKRSRLENCLHEFVGYLSVVADAIRKQREETERVRREYEELAARRREQERQRQEEAERAKQLEATVRRWRLARDIREYVASVRDVLTTVPGTIPDDGQFEESLRWARHSRGALTRSRESGMTSWLS